MSTRKRAERLLVIDILLATLIFALITELWILSIVLVLLALCSLLPLRIGNVDLFGQIFLALLGLAGVWILGIVLGVSDPEQTGGSLGPLGLFISPLTLSIAIPRLYLKEPWLGLRGTVAIVTVAFFALLDGKLQDIYPLLCIVGVAALLVVLKFRDPARSTALFASRDGFLSTIVVLGIAGLVGVSAIWAIPRAYFEAYQWFSNRLAGPSTGFSENLTLGSMSGLEQSNDAVLRIHGPKPDYLRGVVYRSYNHGNWMTGPDGKQSRVSLGLWDEQTSSNTVLIQTIGGDDKHYFVPLGAKKIRLLDEAIRTNSAGLLFPLPGGEASAVRFEPGPRDRPLLATPDLSDLQVPRRLRGRLTALAKAWTRSDDEVEKKLLAILTHLQREYTYSTEFSLSLKSDPLLEFLERNKRGHCEYFASAMALLARSLKIPARVIGGYRVSEYNPIGGYHLVRERNAHAWVEAWVPGKGWQTFDATPGSEDSMRLSVQTGMVSGFFDLLRYKIGNFISFLSQLTSTQIAWSVAVLLILWGAYRGVRFLRKKDQKKEEPDRQYREPIPELSKLLEALEHAGETRGESEPLEHFARRLATSKRLDSKSADEANDLLQRYIAWRYGERGTEHSITAEIETWLRGMRA